MNEVCCLESARLLLFPRRRAPDDPNGDKGALAKGSSVRCYRVEGAGKV
jgi:hypothetical protein